MQINYFYIFYQKNELNKMSAPTHYKQSSIPKIKICPKQNIIVAYRLGIHIKAYTLNQHQCNEIHKNPIHGAYKSYIYT